MAPLVPRMHLFEIDDQPWFPPWFRSRVQAALALAWVTSAPVIQSRSPASLVAGVLKKEVLKKEAQTSFKKTQKPWIMIDFCAGGGGPTPVIEAIINADTEGSASETSETSETTKSAPTRFVLTDLHPHVNNWALAAAASPHIRYASQPVDAAAADPALILKEAYGDASGDAARVMRLFNLSFHHFDDPLAKTILKNTVETSDGFAIFELQDRSFAALVPTLVFGLAILLTAPYYAYKWRSPMTLVFTYLIPVLPFVLVFDGLVSMLRTRTPDEVEALLRTCGADVSTWELRSGEIRHLWPSGYLKWIVCTKNV